MKRVLIITALLLFPLAVFAQSLSLEYNNAGDRNTSNKQDSTSIWILDGASIYYFLSDSMINDYKRVYNCSPSFLKPCVYINNYYICDTLILEKIRNNHSVKNDFYFGWPSIINLTREQIGSYTIRYKYYYNGKKGFRSNKDGTLLIYTRKKEMIDFYSLK